MNVVYRGRRYNTKTSRKIVEWQGETFYRKKTGELFSIDEKGKFHYIGSIEALDQKGYDFDLIDIIKEEEEKIIKNGKRVQISLYITESQRSYLFRIADIENTNITSIISDMIDEYLSNYLPFPEAGGSIPKG